MKCCRHSIQDVEQTVHQGLYRGALPVARTVPRSTRLLSLMAVLNDLGFDITGFTSQLDVAFDRGAGNSNGLDHLCARLTRECRAQDSLA